MKARALDGFIDRSLIMGREVVQSFIQDCELPHRVLDIGAGTGDDLMTVRNIHRDCELHAIECNAHYISDLSARGIIPHSIGLERDVFPFSGGYFDIVIANQILEHIKEIFWVFHEVSRILRVVGHLIVGVPNLASLHNRLLLLLGRHPSCIKSWRSHVRGFTRIDLVTFCKEGFPGGYLKKRFVGSGFYPFPTLPAKCLARCFPNMAYGIFLLLEKVRQYDGGFVKYPGMNKLETNFHVGS